MSVSKNLIKYISKYHMSIYKGDTGIVHLWNERKGTVTFNKTYGDVFPGMEVLDAVGEVGCYGRNIVLQLNGSRTVSTEIAIEILEEIEYGTGH